MIYYENLPLDPSILEALANIQINYVFQSIFLPDGKTVYAREALMRPVGQTVTELIEEFTEKNELHVLEVATFWGATQEYFLRGYTEKLSLNSFPCVCFSDDETKTYIDYFGGDRDILIIESLEYPYIDMECVVRKKKVAAVGDSSLALDDYGVGVNNMDMVDIMEPHIIKIDRSLLSGIDQDTEKQENCKNIIDSMHGKGIRVVAEGVETKEEFDYLVGLGADLFQGYYLERPA